MFVSWFGRKQTGLGRADCHQCSSCAVSLVRLMVVCLPLHGRQSSRLLCVILNALLMHLAPTYLRSQRKLMSILRGTRCWIRGSNWKRFRISHITGTENRSRGREGVKGRPAPLPLSTHQPQWDTLQRPLEALGAGAFVVNSTKAKWRPYGIFPFVVLLCTHPSPDLGVNADSSSKSVVSCGFYLYRSFKV